MKKAIEILEREHEWIGWMAECLESMVAHAKSTGALPELAYDLLLLYETFADGRHQDKEEGVLFPELLAAADERDRDVLGKLLSDHEVERSYMAGMRAKVLGAIHGEPDWSRAFVREASDYLRLHNAHMMRESEILIPMAERLLTPAADERVVQGFEALEGGPGDPHGLREQIRTLYERAGLPKPTAG